MFLEVIVDDSVLVVEEIAFLLFAFVRELILFDVLFIFFFSSTSFDITSQ